MPSSVVDQPPAIRAALRRALPAAAVAAFDYFPRLHGLERLVLANLAAPVSRSLAATLVGFEPSAFSRYFISKTGMTFVEWLTTLRIAYATSLIETQSVSLAVLAARCGFADERALRRAFVRVHGICPRGYRQRLLLGGGSEPSALRTDRSGRFPGDAMRGRAVKVRKLVALSLMVGVMTMTSLPAEALSTLGRQTMGQTFKDDRGVVLTKAAVAGDEKTVALLVSQDVNGKYRGGDLRSEKIRCVADERCADGR